MLLKSVYTSEIKLMKGRGKHRYKNPPTAKILSIDYKGLVSIEFSQDIVQSLTFEEIKKKMIYNGRRVIPAFGV